MNLTRKLITDEGYMLASFYAHGDVVIVANIPKNAIVTGVKIGNQYLEDMCSTAPIYPRVSFDDGYRVVAKLNNAEGSKLYDMVVAGMVESFSVEYYEPYFKMV